MRIFLTGGTGLVGRPVLKALCAQGHEVITLARSDQSAKIQANLGATPIRGSLDDPSQWIDEAICNDAIIHAAATFETDMGDVDHTFVAALLAKAQELPQEKKIPFLFTGGCWLYPAEPVIPITERHVLDPVPEFAWMLDSIEQLHACPNFQLTVIHPGLVVDSGRGYIANCAKDLMDTGSITIVGSADTHFPFVYAEDLADLYLRALSHKGDGLLVNASCIKSATAEEVGKLVASHCGLPYQANVISIKQAQERFGNWASAYARSQRMASDRAQDLLGWNPKADTIAKLVSLCLQADA